MKTIYNTFVVMESQEQCDRMKQLCIDNGLRIWECDAAFLFEDLDYIYFSSQYASKEFFLRTHSEGTKNKTQITEQQFIELLKQSK